MNSAKIFFKKSIKTLKGNQFAVSQILVCFGKVTGEITNDDLLGNIFANFCVGK